METEAIPNQLKKEENITRGSIMTLDENGVFTEAKNVVELPSPLMASLEPVTPTSNRESGESPISFTSPLTLLSLPPKPLCIDDPCSSHEHSPSTPKEGVFDPFAPGADKFMLAPIRTKASEVSRSYVARQLSFNSAVKLVNDGKYESDTESVSDEEMLLESVYDTLLEAIVSKQAETVLAEINLFDSINDGFQTPPSAPRLKGIAEDCPDAPTKPMRKSRTVVPELCRKLEF